MKIGLIIISLWLAMPATYAQGQKFWVFFKEKPTENYDYKQHLSEQAIANRQQLGIPLWQYTDIPVNEQYLADLGKMDITPITTSKWLNATTAHLTEAQQAQVLSLGFVEKIKPMQTFLIPTRHQPPPDKGLELGMAISQMDVASMIGAGLNGEGVIIGVIDAGFYGAHEDRFLKDLFKDDKILGIQDLVNPDKEDHFGKMETYSDDHGTTVLKMIAGKKGKNAQHGFATNADFYLARTDHGDNESRQEEAHWIRAMEWMDSLGVRIINTSLGYALGFDDPAENHKPEEMDGKTTMITKAAQIASDEKGILLIVSAGNEGNDSNWRIVSAPADAAGVISVGATDPSGLKMGYSSTGPEPLDYLKPDVSCFSLGGTSFSAPVITGYAACLMQLNPELTNKELMQVIRQSGHLYPYGNNFIGYGIPNSALAIQLAEGKEIERQRMEVKAGQGNKFTLKVEDKENANAVVFHKSDEKNVVEQDYLSGNKGKFDLEKPKGATRSTVVVGQEVIEVYWE